MMLPLVAIVGRPNVGKSTLFNRLVGRRRALVLDQPGMTRDRHYGRVTKGPRPFHLVDTGGFEPDAADGIEVEVRVQARVAVEEADVVILVCDARQGITPTDEYLARELRASGRPVLVVANKVDGRPQDPLIAECHRLGLSPVVGVSAEHGRGVEELFDAITEALPPGDAPASDPQASILAGSDEDGEFDDGEDDDGAPGAEHDDAAETEESVVAVPEGPIRVALVGRPNAGKSALLNRLIGQQRSIVSPVAGTTRDPVDAELDLPGGSIVLVDTAGIRRRSKTEEAAEKLSVLRAMRCIEEAHIACLLVDAQTGVATQDARIATMALEAGRGLVLVFAKMDLMGPAAAARRRLLEQRDDELGFVDYAPVVYLSSVTGAGVNRLLPTVRRVRAQCGRRIATAELNRFLEHAVESHPPPAFRGRPVRLYYGTQARVAPPTFVVSTNAVGGVTTAYRRYLENRLRDRFGFAGTPIRLVFRQRGRKGGRES
ncbi:MAG: ribosome biogenesis GTPase Der [Deltaproteobacteria bacterium]|nr:ribosome biogenesis GTPase Der [Deltaproteobacteria bacterium]